jgi:hypothetical protein
MQFSALCVGESSPLADIRPEYLGGKSNCCSIALLRQSGMLGQDVVHSLSGREFSRISSTGIRSR